MMRKAYGKDGAQGGGSAAKKVALPALLMALFCLVAGGIDTILDLNYTVLFRFIKDGNTEAIMQVLKGYLGTVGHDAIEQIVGIILVAVAILIRKKHLAKITYKDLAVFGIWLVAAAVICRIGDNIAAVTIGPNIAKYSMAQEYGSSAKSSVLALFSVPLLINWICLAVFILARTGMKNLTRILAGALALIALVLSLGFAFTAGKLAGLFFPDMGGALERAIPALRVEFFFNFILFAVPVLFWLLYGEGQLKFIFAVVYSIAQPALVAFLTVGTASIGAAIANKGGTFTLSLMATVFGEPIAYILGGIAIVVLLVVKKLRKEKKAEKQAAMAN